MPGGLDAASGAEDAGAPPVGAGTGPAPAADAGAGAGGALDAGPRADAASSSPPAVRDAAATPDAARRPDAPPAVPPMPALPRGCGLVACDGVATAHGCCKVWYDFALESEDRNQVARDDLVTSFEIGATDVRASFLFDRAGQDGAVGMLLDRPRRPTAIRVLFTAGGAAGGPPFITVEAVDGMAGCRYGLLAGGQADLARAQSCWGNPGLVPDRINIRVEAIAPGPASLRVTGLQVR